MITPYRPSPGVMYTVAFPEAVIPVKYAFGTNVRISSVFGNNGKAGAVVVTAVAPVVASAAVVP
jgi:hypothetical protein